MHYLLILWFTIFILLILSWIYFYIFQKRINRIESSIIESFLERTDSIIGIYEITASYLEKHTEIFHEILNLRKTEFNLKELSHNIEAFFELESVIHHELNFIFQVCNVHPKLQKDKRFLYMLDIILTKSSSIWSEIKIYNKYIEIFNTMIQYKNYSVIWLLLPFHKKKLLK